MQWIILIGGEDVGLQTIKKIKHREELCHYDIPGIPGRYCVEFATDHIFYDLVDISSDYEKDELLRLPFHQPRFIMMIFQRVERMKEVIQMENFPENIYVDNDRGLVVPKNEYIRLGMPVE